MGRPQLRLLLLFLLALPPTCLGPDYHYFGEQGSGDAWERELKPEELPLGPWGPWICYCLQGIRERSRDVVGASVGPVFLDRDTLMQRQPCNHNNCPSCLPHQCNWRT